VEKTRAENKEGDIFDILRSKERDSINHGVTSIPERNDIVYNHNDDTTICLIISLLNDRYASLPCNDPTIPTMFVPNFYYHILFSSFFVEKEKSIVVIVVLKLAKPIHCDFCTTILEFVIVGNRCYRWRYEESNRFQRVDIPSLISRV
jgi:hypothetical protein